MLNASSILDLLYVVRCYNLNGNSSLHPTALTYAYVRNAPNDGQGEWVTCVTPYMWLDGCLFLAYGSLSLHFWDSASIAKSCCGRYSVGSQVSSPACTGPSYSATMSCGPVALLSCTAPWRRHCAWFASPSLLIGGIMKLPRRRSCDRTA